MSHHCNKSHHSAFYPFFFYPIFYRESFQVVIIKFITYYIRQHFLKNFTFVFHGNSTLSCRRNDYFPVVVLGTIDPSRLRLKRNQSLRARCFPLKVATDQRQALHFTLISRVHMALRRIVRIVRSKRQPLAE